jgi:lipopolysaccharide cholinephosphotransferase
LELSEKSRDLTIDTQAERTIQLAIIKAVDLFCKEHDITCLLAYGSLLGAVRHGGYVPWDDDVDLAMPREDYERFLKEFSHPTFQVYSLQTNQNCRYPFAKVYDTRTEVFEGAFHSISEYGVNIDIFPIDKIPEQRFCQYVLLKRLWFWLNILKIRISRVCSIMTKKQNLIIAIGNLFFFWLSSASLARKINDIAYKYQNYKTSKVGCLVWGYGIKEIVDASLYDSSVQMKFEALQLSVPQGYEKILTSLYGDYLTLPPIHERVTHHDYYARWKNV